MTCEHCGVNDAPDGFCSCDACLEPMREAAALLFAGLAELFQAAREQEAAEKEAA
jgi:hypothetical protein